MKRSMTLDEAVALARRAHADATDKAGRPYIGHALRVMERVRPLGERAMMAAVLHDILEDTALTGADLHAAGCPANVVAAVEILTRHPGEGYGEFVTRVGQSGNPIAIAVKRTDVEDNADEARLALLPAERAAQLRDKYAAAMRIIRGDEGP